MSLCRSVAIGRIETAAVVPDRKEERAVFNAAGDFYRGGVPVAMGMGINYFVVFLMSGSLCAISFLVASLCYNMIGAFLLGMVACSTVISVSFKWIVDKLIPDNVIFMRLVNAFNFS